LEYNRVSESQQQDLDSDEDWSTVNGSDEDDEDKFKVDDKESFTLREENNAFDVAVDLPLILPLHTSILFFSIPKR
jgi:hypothetical protein